jgi:AraC-like DNA-binding protein
MSSIERQQISSNRQNYGLWSTLAKTHLAGTRLPRHQHQTGQLLFATRGIMLVETPSVRWTLPPQRALWIPPGHPHAIHMLSDTVLRTVYCTQDLVDHCPGFDRQQAIHAVAATGLIRELILGLFNAAFDHATQYTMVRLLLLSLRHAQSIPTDVPMPSSDGLRRAVGAILERRQWQLSLHELAELALMSERTFSRRFADELGMTYRTWRQRARIVSSLDLLTDDVPIKVIAHRLQFASAAAYVATFHRLIGCTPTAFRAANGEVTR